MRNSRYRYTRLVMIIDSLMVGGMGLAYLGFPLDVQDLLGLPTVANQEWYSRLTGLLLFALAAHMGTTSRAAHDSAFRRMALLMILVSGSMASMMYAAPGESNNYRMTVVVLAGLWALLYAVTLPIKSVGIQEEN